jgi:hypothetical protein
MSSYLNQLVSDQLVVHNQVLNLVHSSLFPLVYGKTRVLEIGTVDLRNCFDSAGQGKIAVADQRIEELSDLPSKHMLYGLDKKKFWSTKFQCLPCEAKFQDEDSEDVRITSYINNPHPIRHERLYKVVEKIVKASIKSWNEMISRSHHGCLALRIKTRGAEFHPSEPPDWASEITYGAEITEQTRTRIKDYISLPDNPDYIPDGNIDIESWESEDDQWSLVQNKFRQIRRILHPEPGVAYSYQDWKQGKTDNAVVRRRRRGPYSNE